MGRFGEPVSPNQHPDPSAKRASRLLVLPAIGAYTARQQCRCAACRNYRGSILAVHAPPGLFDIDGRSANGNPERMFHAGRAQLLPLVPHTNRPKPAHRTLCHGIDDCFRNFIGDTREREWCVAALFNSRARIDIAAETCRHRPRKMAILATGLPFATHTCNRYFPDTTDAL